VFANGKLLNIPTVAANDMMHNPMLSVRYNLFGQIS
jgi:hypothetical protein